MSKFLSVFIVLVGFSVIAADADARRMSGGKNMGRQREAINPSQTAPKAPAQQQQQAAPAQQKAAPTAPPAQQPSGMSRWLGPLAGLAIGAGLASLFMNNGLGGALMGMLMVAAIVFGAVLLFRLLRGRGNQSVREPLRYAAATPSGSEPLRAPPAAPIGGSAAPHSIAATLGSSQAAPAPAAAPLLADFDSEQFLQHARTNFVKLQAAHDRKDLTSIRDFLTPQLYRDIEADVSASGDAAGKTEIVTLNAEVLDVASEAGLYVVSVRFSGLIRDEPGAEAQPFSELWHLEKPVSGRSGWLVSGIQQA